MASGTAGIALPLMDENEIVGGVFVGVLIGVKHVLDLI